MRLISITAIDEGKKLRLVYHFDNDGQVVTKERELAKSKPVTQSIVRDYPGAEFYEREAHDLFGAEFQGNPHLHESLFLPDDYHGKPPFLKRGK
jgi:NADH-quinone oxidoreductase subunit C